MIPRIQIDLILEKYTKNYNGINKIEISDKVL